MFSVTHLSCPIAEALCSTSDSLPTTLAPGFTQLYIIQLFCSFRLDGYSRAPNKDHTVHVIVFLSRDLEATECPIYSVNGHKEIINCIDGVGGLGIGEGAPEIATGSRDGMYSKTYMKPFTVSYFLCGAR